MRSQEKRPDRGRPPSSISWRELIRLDAGGIAVVGMFLITVAVLGIVMLLTSYNVHS
jgi:hypothetical protein